MHQKSDDMASFKYDSTRTQYVEFQGIKFAFRKFGKESSIPLVLLIHFRGSMDNWDPKLLDALAMERTVIVFDNKGVASTNGLTQETYREMANGAAEFIQALGYTKVDVLGFSIGGHMAQELLFHHGDLIRKAILASTMPQGGKGLTNSKPEVIALAIKPVIELTDFLTLFFEQSTASQKAGRAYIERRKVRILDVEPATSEQTMQAQGKARKAWAEMDESQGLANLRKVTQPVLVSNGSNDVMIPTAQSFSLYQNLPNAQLILYPDSGHGFLFQYPDLVAEHIRIFLDQSFQD
jgi:pimeloyl-ACP methyl ester carboxylesterase